MHQSVRAIFPTFASSLEAKADHMYLDRKGLVSIGIGCIIDPLPMVIDLPFKRRSDRASANRVEVVQEWRRIKNDKSLIAADRDDVRKVTSLVMNISDIDRLICSRLLSSQKILRKTFGQWDQWPADAQLAVLSMAWSEGSDFMYSFPKLVSFCLANDWSGAAGECAIKTFRNDKVAPRNRIDRDMFVTAARVAREKLDSSRLWQVDLLRTATT
jgi:GH24 family phage-related lysozyme (muramidase)